MPPELISTLPSLKTFLDNLPSCTGRPPSIYVDLEGNKLSRLGTLSLITILVWPQNQVFLIDVTSLQGTAFNTTGSSGRTLKSLLESEEIVKVFFDIRRDSDALFSHYGVRVRGIEDLQLMELASRNFAKRYITGLAKCIGRDAEVPYAEKQRWLAIKNKGHKLFDPNRGGSYAVFDQRPLSDEISEYCVQDVIFMPHLRDVYLAKLCDAWWNKIEEETKARIQFSQSATFDPNAATMAQGPPAWLNWYPSRQQISSRVLLDKAVQTSISPDASKSTTGRPATQTTISKLSEAFQTTHLSGGRIEK